MSDEIKNPELYKKNLEFIKKMKERREAREKARKEPKK